MALSEEMKLAIKITAQDTTKQAFGQLNQSLNGIKNTALAVAGAVAGALAFRDVIDTVKRTSDEISMLTDNFGMTAEQASKLNFALKVVGSSADDFTTSVAFLNKHMIDSLPLLQKGEDDFTKWGLTFVKANGDLRGTGDVLADIRVKMQQAGAGQAAMGMGQDLLGKSNRNLTEFMQLTDAEMVQLGKDAEDLGQVFSAAGVKDMKQFTRDLNKVGIGFDGIKLQIGQFMIPLLRSLLHWFQQNAGAIKAFAEALQKPLGILKEFAQRVGKFFEDIKTVGLAAALQQLVTDAVAAAKTFLPKLGEELDKLGPLGWALKVAIASTAFSLAVGVAEGMFGGLLTVLMGAIKLMTFGVGALGAPLAISVLAGLTIGIITAQVLDQLGVTKTLLTDVEFLAKAAGIVGLGAAALLATAGAPLTITILGALVIGITSAVVLDQIKNAIEGNVLRDPNFWIKAMGLAGIAGVAVGSLIAGGPLIITVPATLLISALIRRTFAEGALPPGFQPPGVNYPEHGGLAGSLPSVDTLPIADQQAYIRQMFPQNFGTGGPHLMAEGGAGIATRPTLFLAGERGPESFAFGRAAGGGPNITVNVSGNVTRSERELAEIVAGEIIRRMRGTGQSMGSPTSLGGFY